LQPRGILKTLLQLGYELRNTRSSPDLHCAASSHTLRNGRLSRRSVAHSSKMTCATVSRITFWSRFWASSVFVRAP